MIETVTFEETTYNQLPFKFEAGTPNIADTIAFGKAIDFMEKVGVKDIAEWEMELHNHAVAKLSEIQGMQFIGTAARKAGVISFNVEGIHPYDLGTILDQQGIAVRTGHHCTQPLMDRFGVPGTVRASFAVYNTKNEIDRFIAALQKAVQMLK